MLLQSVHRLSTATSVTKYGQMNKRFVTVLSRTTDYLMAGCQSGVNKAQGIIHGPTAEDVTKGIDLSGKTCVITGGNSGIGLEITRVLVKRNCDVIVGCRNTYAAGVVIKNVCDSTDRLKIYEMNLASLASVKNFSNTIIKNQKKIDMLILNAAIFGLPWTSTKDRLETIFQVNYLSQYYLLMKLENILAPDARVVFVSSESHRNIKWSPEKTLSPSEDILSLPKEEYTSIKAYNISKLCSILAMHYLGYRWLNTGKSVFCTHPGSFVKTKLCRNWWVYEALYTFMLPFSKTISQAASGPIYCATSPELNGLSALYYKDLKQCEESELAKDSYLSFRINDLTRSIIRDRVTAAEEVVTRESNTEQYAESDQTKSATESERVEETLISNYSG